MHYRYRNYPYYRRYYNLNPYYYGRYYNPYYNYQQNIIDSQIADVDQSVINYGDMSDVIQDSYIYQSMEPAPVSPEPVEVPPVEPPPVEPPTEMQSLAIPI
jgi:ABC-type antimicrobial peptide transport system permease subunit